MHAIEGMFFQSLLKYAIVFTITHQNISQAAPEAKDRQINKTNPEVSASSLIKSAEQTISVQDVTIRNDKVFNDNSERDKRNNGRESLSSARPLRHSDEPLHNLDDYFSNSDSATPGDPLELPECILSHSQHYLSWLVAMHFLSFFFLELCLNLGGLKVGQRRWFIKSVSNESNGSKRRFHRSFAEISFR